MRFVLLHIYDNSCAPTLGMLGGLHIGFFVTTVGKFRARLLLNFGTSINGSLPCGNYS